MYAAYGVIDTTTPEGLEAGRTAVFDALVNNAVPMAIAHKQGLTLTEEELAAAMENVESDMGTYLSEFMNDAIEDEEERKAEAIKSFNAAYKANGISYESVREESIAQYKDQALADKLRAQVMDSAAQATDAECKAWYDEQIALEREAYAADATAYYYDSQNYSYLGEVQPLVAPEGLFYVKHILIKHTDPNSTATATDAENTRDAQALAQSILDKVNAGEDFDALIAEYGEDPGMLSEPTKTTGYVLGEGYDAVYDAAFYEAAMELKETGDTSGLVNGSNGYHIIRRVGDVSTDPVPYADVQEEILSYLNGQKQSQAYSAQLEEWKQEVTIKIYEKRVEYVGVE